MAVQIDEKRSLSLVDVSQKNQRLPPPQIARHRRSGSNLEVAAGQSARSTSARGYYVNWALPMGPRRRVPGRPHGVRLA